MLPIASDPVYRAALEADADASAFLLPRTSSVLRTPGAELHVRAALPEGSPRALVVFVHGYGGHASRPSTKLFMQDLLARRLAFLAPEQRGHGYTSEANVDERCLIHDVGDLVDDLEGLVRLAAGDRWEAGELQLEDPGALRRLAGLPVVLVGQSLGGLVSFLLAERLAARPLEASRFLGCVLLSPLLHYAEPPWVVTLVGRVMRALAPRSVIPRALNPLTDNSVVWKDEGLITFVEKDKAGLPGAIAWNRGIRWGTAGAIVEGVRSIQAMMDGVRWPFLICMDPQDAVCDFTGAANLHARAQSSRKELVEVPGGRHDVLMNEFSLVLGRLEAFIAEQLQEA